MAEHGSSFQPCPSPGSVILVSTGGLGDTILFSPVIKAAHRAYPTASIRLVAASALVRDVYRHAPELTAVDWVDTNRKCSPSLYGQLWQLAQACRQGAEHRLLISASRLSPWLIKMFRLACAPRWVLSDSHPPKDMNDLSVNQRLAGALVSNAFQEPAYVPIRATARQEALDILQKEFGVSDPRSLIWVYPSVELPQRPRVDPRVLVDAALVLAGRWGCRVAVMGGLQEQRQWEQCKVEASAYQPVMNLATRLSPEQLASLLSVARLALCNDGGLAHLAGAMDCPLVTLMTNTRSWHTPPGAHTRLLLPDALACFPCYPRRPLRCKNRAIPDCVAWMSRDRIIDTGAAFASPSYA